MSTAETIESESVDTATDQTTEQNTADETTEETGSFATQDHATGDAEGEEGEGSKGDEQEAKEEGDSEESTPTEYAEFALPDGMILDEGRLESATELFGSLDLSQENAQKLVDWYVQDQATVAEQTAAAQAQQNKEWISEIQSDPTLGGQNEKATVANCARALEAFEMVFPDGRSLSKLLDETGLGNRIEIVDFLSAVGGAIAEDQGGSGGEASEGNPLHALYPTMESD